MLGSGWLLHALGPSPLGTWLARGRAVLVGGAVAVVCLKCSQFLIPYWLTDLAQHLNEDPRQSMTFWAMTLIGLAAPYFFGGLVGGHLTPRAGWARGLFGLATVIVALVFNILEQMWILARTPASEREFDLKEFFAVEGSGSELMIPMVLLGILIPFLSAWLGGIVANRRWNVQLVSLSDWIPMDELFSATVG